MGRRVTLALGLAILLLASSGHAVPNLVMLSIDDGLTENALETVYTSTVVESGVANPNGCRPPVTWFTDSRSDCDAVLEAYSLGHELATHTVSHPNNGDSLSYEEWIEEVGGQRTWLVGCGVPEDEVKGFRAPYYVTNGALGNALEDLGFFYDSSLRADYTLAAPLNEEFPYTCGSSCEGWEELSLWEVPADALPGSGGRRSDPAPADGKSISERLQEDFETKRGSGVPVAIKMHEPYLRDSSNRGEIVAFLRWALGQEDTWAVTYTQYISWIQAGLGSIADVVSNSTCNFA